ncbi:MAG: GTPase ObgE [Candidatus Eisenbacteria sp.]|nr:GTPase ObgE [Candidatus Eisenbacteria bacterium]
MFVDECTIRVVGGCGGNGCVSFRREKFIPRGGPDGGDGGDGGSVLLRVNQHMRTLNHLRHTPQFRAGAGRPGLGKQMSGGRGQRVYVEVPPGTMVTDAETGEQIADAIEAGSEIILARGGRRGVGNVHFKSSVRRAPRIATKGKPGEQRRPRLTLKLLADIGLVGRPNAGKSTLLARLSNARPKIADYPFTTLAPVLGIVPVGEYSSLVLADLPGLIEGAADGKGLGQRFLRHIERTRLLLVLIESIDTDPESTYSVLRRELEGWSQQLGSKQHVVCYTKAELLTDQQRERLPQLGPTPPLLISSHTGMGIRRLLGVLDKRVLELEDREVVLDSQAVSVQERQPVTARPWPHRWVLPRRPAVRVPGEGEQEGEA